MTLISNFNPLKVYEDNRFIRPLYDMLDYIGDEICFIGDEAGYFFCPLRRFNNASICFSKENFYLLFTLLKHDLQQSRRMFQGYLEVFDVDLLKFYEKEVFNDTRPFLRAYYTMILSLLSNNISGDFCNYIGEYDNRLHERVFGLNKFDISGNDIFWEKAPNDKFFISYEKEILTTGILMTNKQQDHKLLDEVDGLKYYYVR